MRYFTIRDIKAEGWNEPFKSATRATAMRELTIGLAKDDTMRSYSSDFQLFETAVFDNLTGITMGHEFPVHICDISDLTFEMPEIVETTPKIGVA